MEIKELKEKDVPKLFDLYSQLIGKEGNYTKMCRVLNEIQDCPHYKLFCVYQDDELIATASLTKCFDLTGDAKYYYSMENFVVDERYRGKGVGTFLLQELEQYVSENDGSYMNFTSSMSRKDAHLFYENRGYHKDYVKGYKKVF